MVDINLLRSQFKSFLQDKVAKGELSKSDADSQYPDADYPRKHEVELGINYFEMFKNEETFNELLSILQQNFRENGKSENTFSPYKRALINFKDFYNQSYTSLTANYYIICQSHNYEKEKAEGYISAPDENRPYWQCLKKLKKGDILLSYTSNTQTINAILTIISDRFDIDNNNCIVKKAKYNELENKIQKKVFIQRLKNANINLNYKNSPINKKMNINLGYCFPITKEIYDTILFDTGNNLTVQQWQELLQNNAIFDKNSIEVVKAFNSHCNGASCQYLSQLYGREQNYYNSISSHLGQRVQEYTKCSIDENSNSKYVEILYNIRKAEQNEIGSWIWQVKPELSEALEIYNNGGSNNMNNNFPLNQILYGPPGTGKTYNTVLKAMSIIEGCEYKDVGSDKYKDLKNRFDDLKNEGRIEFITFHQSYSYEEFVEGIKPYIPEWKSKPADVKYMGTNGIFKEICERAINKKELCEKHFSFENLSVYKILIPDNSLFEYCLENKCVAINWGDDIDFTGCDNIDDIDKRVPEDLEHRKQCISQMNLFKLWVDNDLKKGKDVIVVVPNSINSIKAIGQITGEYVYNSERYDACQRHAVNWIKTGMNLDSGEVYESKFVSPTITGMYNDKINKEKFLKLINNVQNANSDKYVLIIDEINRGNVSKIFGELITLIEEDKRIGCEYEMKTTLPYSKESFGVPKNLYIIGTMNTADRSIALLDTALRRRFDFEEIMPKPKLLHGKVVCDIDLEKLLENINKRITKDFDRDHQIGHSYLMNVSNEESLKRAYKNRILPLLNEYFYNDKESVAKILNCSTNDLEDVNCDNFIKILKEAQKNKDAGNN